MSVSEAPSPRAVHLVFKTHLDIGFTDRAATVVRQYFERDIPRAIALASELRARGGPERFVWTVGSWLIYEYLEQADAPARRRLEAAILAGDIAWHAWPFTTMTELLDPGLCRFALTLSQELDARFGRRTIAAKMTDVPGHPRALAAYLAEAGVRLLHVGVNPVSTPPDVPPIFRWVAPGGAEIVVIYSKEAYGDTLRLPACGTALRIVHGGDNAGPPSVETVQAAFAAARAAFPGSHVQASTLDAFAAAAWDVRAQLPVVTGEIGDTWAHGLASDPGKVARFRALCRVRAEWDAAGTSDTPAVKAFSRQLLLVAEHTWGMDEKVHLAATERPAGALFAKHPAYARAEFQVLRRTDACRRFEDSWVEQRAYLDAALDALRGTPCEAPARAAVVACEPVRPDPTRYRRLDPAAGARATRHFRVGVDPADGALIGLEPRGTGGAWADADHPLGRVRYQTFSQADYDRYVREYLRHLDYVFSAPWTHADWAIPDFTKPEIEAAGARSQVLAPQLTWLGEREDEAALELLAEVAFPEWCGAAYGAPRRLMLTYRFPHDRPQVELTLQWFEKQPCRLPEALWCSFVPRMSAPVPWCFDVLGCPVRPDEVVVDGARHLFAVTRGARAATGTGTWELETLDAPLIAAGEPGLLRHDNRLPDPAGGLHVNLYNNLWGTNFPMWYGDDARFRFVLRPPGVRQD